jgi:hypothetical protein
MLIYSETLAAIRALDTDLDIIVRACDEISRESLKNLDTKDLAQDMFDRYNDIEDQAELLKSTSFFLAGLSSILAKRGHEKECLAMILESVTEAFQFSQERLKIMRAEGR